MILSCILLVLYVHLHKGPGGRVADKTEHQHAGRILLIRTGKCRIVDGLRILGKIDQKRIFSAERNFSAGSIRIRRRSSIDHIQVFLHKLRIQTCNILCLVLLPGIYKDLRGIG